MKKNQKQYWDKVAKNKKFTTYLDISLLSKYLDKESLIVDYGCGYGRTLNELFLNNYKNTIGFDFSPKMIEKGKKKFPFLNLKVSVDNHINCESNSVDVIILFAVLTCIIDDVSQISLMEEIQRVLKPGGLIYINDFLINEDDRNKNRYNKYLNEYNTYGVFELEEGAVLRHHNENWIKQLTSEFKSKEFNHITFRTMNGHISNGFVFIGAKK